MDRPNPMSASRATSRAPHALVLAAALAGFLAAGQVLAQGGAASPEMASQKAMMLKGFFASSRLAEAREANPDGVAPLEAEARAKLEAGERALAEGRVARAVELFDEGMRMVSRAVALAASVDKGAGKKNVSKAFEERRGSAGSYLSVLERADDLSGDERTRVAALRESLQKADRQYAAGDLERASATLDGAYGAIVDLVTAIRRGRTLTVSRVFETPKAEYEYEVSRHESYVLLVDIALAERAASQPGLELLAARLGAESDRLRAEAARQSDGGDYVTAIQTMESATERLLVILRATGAIVME